MSHQLVKPVDVDAQKRTGALFLACCLGADVEAERALRGLKGGDEAANEVGNAEVILARKDGIENGLLLLLTQQRSSAGCKISVAQHHNLRSIKETLADFLGENVDMLPNDICRHKFSLRDYSNEQC
ncbi:hypothetical protein TYRP_015866 [Tyrophagus putrescentiae]|nr:hypothetical protein TYRP_015866 [Tyrophagus putrescentiae]